MRLPTLPAFDCAHGHVGGSYPSSVTPQGVQGERFTHTTNQGLLHPSAYVRSGGRDLSKRGSWSSVGLAIAFFLFANNTPGVGDNAYYVTKASSEVLAGAGLTLGAALVGLSAALYLHRRPGPATGILSVTTVLVFLGPSLTTWDPGWLGVMTLIMGVPVVLILLGIGSTLRGLTPHPVH